MNTTIDFHNPTDEEGTDVKTNTATARAKAIADHAVHIRECEMAIYVTTARKYDFGNRDGVWMDPMAYEDEAEFLEACHAVHCDEADPEFLMTFHAGIPIQFVDFSGLDARFWHFSKEWQNLDDDEKAAVRVYWKEVMGSPTDCSHSKHWCPAEIIENFVGCFDSMRDLGDELLEMAGWLSQIPEQMHSYVDTADFANDCRLGGDIYIVEDEMKFYVYWTH